MAYLSTRRLSILGLVVMSASAITAAMLPGKARIDSTPDDGTLCGIAVGCTTDFLTCKSRTEAFSCNRSTKLGQSTNTSVPANASSVRNCLTTMDQTSNSAAGYQTSISI